MDTYVRLHACAMCVALETYHVIYILSGFSHPVQLPCDVGGDENMFLSVSTIVSDGLDATNHNELFHLEVIASSNYSI